MIWPHRFLTLVHWCEILAWRFSLLAKRLLSLSQFLTCKVEMKDATPQRTFVKVWEMAPHVQNGVYLPWDPCENPARESWDLGKADGLPPSWLLFLPTLSTLRLLQIWKSSCFIFTNHVKTLTCLYLIFFLAPGIHSLLARLLEKLQYYSCFLLISSAYPFCDPRHPRPRSSL